MTLLEEYIAAAEDLANAAAAVLDCEGNVDSRDELQRAMAEYTAAHAKLMGERRGT